MDQTSAEARARWAAMAGIPLAKAGEIGEIVGGTRWLGMGPLGTRRWWYQGMEAWICEGRNTTLVASPETGMSAEDFGRLWRDVVRDLMRKALCVRVRVCEPKEET